MFTCNFIECCLFRLCFYVGPQEDLECLNHLVIYECIGVESESDEVALESDPTVLCIYFLQEHTNELHIIVNSCTPNPSDPVGHPITFVGEVVWFVVLGSEGAVLGSLRLDEGGSILFLSSSTCSIVVVMDELSHLVVHPQFQFI